MRLFSVSVRALLALVVVALAIPVSAGASAPTGAIFTTLADGSEVNFNHYAAKEDVYLDGGPGPGAPATAAGLDDGTYVFQVTNPNGRVLLSTDPANCRQFTVSGGIITGVVATGCQHVTGVDIDHGATTVQLVPYLDTPNPGGVYKVWATKVADYLAGCAALGVSNGLSVVDCGFKAGVAVHGFVPSDSKTDNFKVKAKAIVEIDTRFFDAGSGDVLLGRKVKWTDPLGGSNIKWSYFNPELLVNNEAHVEAAEKGIHLITVADQPGCTVQNVTYAGKTTKGPRTVAVNISNENKDQTLRIDVACA